MGRGSVLKNLKGELQSNDLLRHQKRKKGDQHQAKLKKERDEQNLRSIREAFNPFNSKFDNKKSPADGRKVAGRPVAARSAAEEHRKRTWEAEKRLKNKIGGLVDRRFGERDKTMSEEDKMVERFAREKLNNLRKMGSRKSFNIEEEDTAESYSEDILTHGGRTLDFEDDFVEDDLGVESDEEDHPVRKKLRPDHPTEDQEEEERPERPKTKAEVMQEIIAKSKMHKLERQQQRQADDELVDNLNAGFDDLMADLASAEEQRQKQKRDVDRYDLDLQELAFEKRADPSDRTKTEEELAREREEEKKAAERAKTARMEGDELDINVDGATDDAYMFGLQDYSDEESVVGGSGSEDEDVAGESSDQTHQVNIPEDLSSLERSVSDLENVGEKVRYFVKLATPTRGSGSKTQLQNLSAAVFHYAIKHSHHFDEMTKILHDIAPKHDVGLRLANEARDLVHSAKRRSKWNTKELLLFSLIGSLFSTSDQWHVVATSASLVITQKLSQSVEADLGIITTNLFLCDLLLVYQRLSKRYIPEVPGYLLRILAMVSPANAAIAERYVRLSPSRLGGKNGLSKISKSVEGKANLSKPASSLEEIVVIIGKIVNAAASLWRSLEAFPEVFRPLERALSTIPHDDNPIITETLSKLTKLIHFSSKDRRFLQLQQFRPLGIITHAPLFDENYNPEVKGASLDPERRELQKLKALHKKERKSTLREIRRDAEFESRQRLNDKRREMAEYHDKLRRLEGQINGEEGAERNAYEREKQKRRRR